MTSIGSVVRRNLLEVRIALAKEGLKVVEEHNDWMACTPAAEVARIFAEYEEPPPGLFDLEFFRNRVAELKRKRDE